MSRPLSDPERWTVSVLSSPKRQRFARGLGLCGASVTGLAESGGGSAPFWWPGGQPAAIVLDGKKWLSIHGATGDAIPGFWSRSSGGRGGAVGFRLVSGALEPAVLHPSSGWSWTAALGSGGGAFAGYGEPAVKKGERAVERALYWRADGVLVELPPHEAGKEAMAHATDGAWVVGRTGLTGRQQAALWPADGARVVVLGDGDSVTEASCVADGEQVGVRWNGRANAVALWRGRASSFVDLTPVGHQSGWAWGCAGGFQVGHVQVNDTTRSGASSMARKAALWSGDAASFVDLQALVPAPWNASGALAVEVRGGVLRIAGEVTQFGTEHELTPRESQFVIASRAVLWETRLD